MNCLVNKAIIICSNIVIICCHEIVNLCLYNVSLRLIGNAPLKMDQSLENVAKMFYPLKIIQSQLTDQ